MVFISIAFAARKIACAFEHSSIRGGELREIDFSLLNFPRQSPPGKIGETLLSRCNCPPDFSVEALGNL
jgi:hypothetical protein